MGNLLPGVSFKEPTTVEECDSTWDTDSGGEDEGEDEEEAEREQEEKKRSGMEDEAGTDVMPGDREDATSQSDCNTADLNIKPKRSFYAARDLYKYRHQYPNFKDLRCQNDLCNLRFYMNKIPFKPDGVYIEEILNKWKGDYDKLEHNHTYIQWLFPLREQGLNFYAKELTSYEIEEFKKTKEAIKRFILAYKMMLDFFGLKLMDKNGSVSRATNWQDRFQHLNESQHNYLRITRILKSLGELGYESFKSPLVKAFLEESIVENTIPNMKQSALEYFVYTVKERKERRKLLRYASLHYQPQMHFIWGPDKNQKSGQNKSIKKSSLNRSLKKNTQKFRDNKTENSLERPQSSAVEDTKVETEQVDDVKSKLESEADGNEQGFNNVSKNDDSSSEHSPKAVLHPIVDSSVPSATGEEDNEPYKENNIVSIIIVDSTDVGNTDCLCNLSPSTSTNVNVTEPSGTDDLS
ncbi:opioid growth factor receptor-like protein 1 isoform 2-T2 [Anomaloglossus baeobatrachus]|uniref:opioid growth factor receptor-like protein 1 isoform X2 n=1 Tax=Anomaloglossus baeobatrachus TaxID=238106 RepID=UPI003F5091F2